MSPERPPPIFRLEFRRGTRGRVETTVTFSMSQKVALALIGSIVTYLGGNTAVQMVSWLLR